MEGSQGTGRGAGELRCCPRSPPRWPPSWSPALVTGSAGELEVRSIAVMGAVFEGVGWWLDRRTLGREQLVATLADLVCNGLGGAPATD